MKPGSGATIVKMSRAAVLVVLGLCGCGSDPKPAPKPATRTLHVRLVDGQGKPVEAAGKSVWWAENPEAEYGTPVGPAENGEIVLKDIPAGPVVLVALPDGFVVPSERWPRKVVAAGVLETDLVLDVGDARTLHILGWDAAWSGLAYLAAIGDLEPSQHGVEDDGTVNLEGLRPGVRYNLYVRDFETGRCALLRGLPADEPWPEFEMAQGQDLTGHIVLPEGCDSWNVAVLLDKAALIDGPVEEDGTFRIPAVPAGAWTVVAYATCGDRYFAATAEVSAGASAVLDLTKAPPK